MDLLRRNIGRDIMTNNRLSEGVGKKIVEALKKQSEIEVNQISTSSDEEISLEAESFETFEPEEPKTQTIETQEDDFFSSLSSDNDMSPFAPTENDFAVEEPVFVQPTIKQSVNKPFAEVKQAASPIVDTFSNDLDSFEIPSNIAVLKKLITQLPSGVTRHTGAQIIR